MPESEHKYLKMCCHKIGKSIKDFVLECTIERIDAWEDEWMIERMKKDGTWNKNSKIEQKDGKLFITYEDGETHELVPHETYFNQLVHKNEAKNV